MQESTILVIDMDILRRGKISFFKRVLQSFFVVVVSISLIPPTGEVQAQSCGGSGGFCGSQGLCDTCCSAAEAAGGACTAGEWGCESCTGGGGASCPLRCDWRQHCCPWWWGFDCWGNCPGGAPPPPSTPTPPP